MEAHDWEYCAEGAMNIALRYVGLSQEFVGKVLRLRKASSNPETLLECHQFVESVMVPLIGREFCHENQVIELTEEFLQHVEAKISPLRPHKRIKMGGLDLASPLGLLMRDCSKLVCDECESICFEIKPKWGFLPKEPTKFPIKHQVCRFTMHQHFKQTLSEYSPLDLFSLDKPRMLRALQSLRANPQNNLKLFVNGNQVLDPKACAEYFTDDKFNLVIQVLLDTDVLSKVLCAQTVGSLVDIESVYPLYSRLEGVTNSPLGLPLPGDSSDKAKVDEFLISCTARDCSIMLTFAKCEHLHQLALPQCQGFSYLLAVVDLDPKPYTKMNHYFALDQEIAQAYTNRIKQEEEEE
ncbi:hypothetical protein BASA81_002785 [Batrachochytrium salamandrivorans]|nr:hypothetical protein BASA81_002785 [Batrachochytrium salamandrivorans]